MDAAKKAALEKRIVMGLSGVFAVTFAMGPLRSTGIFGGRRAPVTTVEQVSVSKPIGQMMQERWQQLTPQVEAPTAAPATPLIEGPRLYTARELRDPLQSWLPKLPRPEVAASTKPTAPEPPPPPSLHVQGLLWGGPEPKAIINDDVYGMNDFIDGSKIIEIDRHGITIEYRGRPVFYALSPMTQTGSSP